MQLWLLGCVLAAAADPASALRRFEYSELHMGVRVRIAMYAPEEAQARRAARAAFDRFAALDRQMSDYRYDSELMLLCARAGQGPMAIPEDLFRVLQTAQEIASRSGGAFDVTCGAVVQLWRRARRDRALPSHEELRRALGLTGRRFLQLDPRRRTAEVKRFGVRLDLGGIAKGYACDQALAVLAKHGVRSALVEAGGDIAMSAPPPGRKGWSIQVPGGHKGAVLLLSNQAISTSGDLEQFVEIGGVRYSHIVDPRTGIGLTNRLLTAVIGPRCTLTDALATAICVLGERQGRLLAREYGVKVIVQRAGPAPRRAAHDRRPRRSPTLCPGRIGEVGI
jgi:thiamine biosynthesis lipoprotein